MPYSERPIVPPPGISPERRREIEKENEMIKQARDRHFNSPSCTEKILDFFNGVGKKKDLPTRKDMRKILKELRKMNENLQYLTSIMEKVHIAKSEYDPIEKERQQRINAYRL